MQPRLHSPDHASRRLALNACNTCRRRKTRCDEKKPQCGRCARLNLDCEYVETAATIKTMAVTELNSTLERLESKLDAIKESLNDTQRLLPAATGTASFHVEVPRRSPAIQATTVIAVDSPVNSTVLHRERSKFVETEPAERLRIPKFSHAHLTAPQHMLLWPCAGELFQNLHIQYPVALEIGRSKLLHVSSFPDLLAPNLPGLCWFDYLSIAQIRRLTANFFENFHISTLIIDEDLFCNQTVNDTTRSRFPRNLATCEFIFVIALGALADSRAGQSYIQPGTFPQNSDLGPDQDADSLALFNVGCKMFLEVEQADWHSVQCWLLMGLFYSARLHVYEHWSAVQRAAALIMTLLPLNTSHNELHCRLYWTAYLQESQILAEFDFFPTGLRGLENAMPLPFADDDIQHRQCEEYRFFFLAQVSLRRLLNRIHANLYTPDRLSSDYTAMLNPSFDPNTLSPRIRNIMQELNLQLEMWKTHLPQSLQFSGAQDFATCARLELHGPRTMHDRLMGSLQSRYFAARSIINRPYVYGLLNPAGLLPSPEDEEKARVALEAQLLIPLKSGVLRERLTTLPHPINPCRSFIAAAILLEFISKSARLSEVLLPEGWQVLNAIREQLVAQAVPLSPVISHDLELLETMSGIN